MVQLALLQTVVADDMQGRVLALVISLANAMTPIGLLIAGPVAEKTGVSALFIFASLMFIVSGVFTYLNADVRNIEDTGGGAAPDPNTASQAASTPV